MTTATLLLSSIAISVTSLALPVVTLQFYDRILPNQSSGTLSVLVAGMMVVVCLEILLRLTRAYVLSAAGSGYVHDVSCKAMDRILNAASRGGPQAGDAVGFQDLSALRSLKSFHDGTPLVTLVELLFIPPMLALIAYIGGPLVLVPVVLLSGFVLHAFFSGRRLKAALASRDSRDDNRYDFLIDSLRRIHWVKATAHENYLQRRYERLQARSCEANLHLSEVIANSFNVSALVSHSMTAVTVGFGALAVIDGSLSLGSLIAVAILSGRVMQPVQRGLMLWTRYQNYRVARKKAEGIFALPPVLEEKRQAPLLSTGDLEISNLRFSPEGDETFLLDGIDLSVRKGEAVALLGPPGTGKTALLRLIAGLQRPSSGRILVNGRQPTALPSETLNEQVGYMPSSGTIFRGSIRDNITRFGQVPVSQAMDVARLLGMDEEIARLPAGLDTPLEGTSADSIPPGVKQRIALIRTLSTKPRILLFDNAERMLDLAGYSKLYGLLGRLKSKTTMVIVSDDENLRRLADRFYRLEGGKALEVSREAAAISLRENSPRVRL